jgi:hypothetical protein
LINTSRRHPRLYNSCFTPLLWGFGWQPNHVNGWVNDGLRYDSELGVNDAWMTSLSFNNFPLFIKDVCFILISSVVTLLHSAESSTAVPLLLK